MAVSAPVSCSALEGQAEGPVVAARGIEEISRCSPRLSWGVAAVVPGEEVEEEEDMKGSHEDQDDDDDDDDCCCEVGSAAGTAAFCAGWGI